MQRFALLRRNALSPPSLSPFLLLNERLRRIALSDKKQSYSDLEAEGVDITTRHKRVKADAHKKKEEALAKTGPLEDDDGHPSEIKLKLEALSVTSLSELEVALVCAMIVFITYYFEC